MQKHWTAEEVLELTRRFQPACVLAAAAELDLFSALATEPLTAVETATKLDSNPRGTTVLLDALVALGLLEKHEGKYSVPESLVPLLTTNAPASVLPMVQHQANCLRRWAQLACVVKTGCPADCAPSIRGESGDNASFIGAMHSANAAIADKLVREIQPLEFHHLLDVGGASGTWTIAFLRACPSASATLFDLPHVIPLAKQRLGAAGVSKRVRLVAGDYNVDALPRGADFAWVSAIVHQNSREQNRKLFANIFRALSEGGRIVIRDVLMDETRTSPLAGALFAVNMLVATEGGGTFTFEELRADLESAGFTGATVLRRDNGMNSLVAARKP